MAKETLNLRIDGDIKKESEQVLKEIGLSMTSAVTIFLKAVARTRTIPFSLEAATQVKAVEKKEPEPAAELLVTPKPVEPTVVAETSETVEKPKPKGNVTLKSAINKL